MAAVAVEWLEVLIGVTVVHRDRAVTIPWVRILTRRQLKSFQALEDGCLLRVVALVSRSVASFTNMFQS